MPTPKLTVMTANYNQGHYLQKALSQVTSQSRLPDEYLIIDDGSTDNSVEIIKPYADKFSFIRFTRHETNQGFFKTVDHLRSMITGDYVYGCSADDYPMPGFFETAMDLASQYPNAGAILGKMVAVDARGRHLMTYRMWSQRKTGFMTPEAFYKDYVSIESPAHSLGAATIYNVNALNGVGNFRQELGTICDTFATRALGLKHGVCYIAKDCVTCTVMPDSMSQKTLNNKKSMTTFITNAACIMRSEEFKDIFPSRHVDRWETAYLRMVRIHDWKIARLAVKCITRLMVIRPLGFIGRFCVSFIRCVLIIKAKYFSRS